MSTISTVSSNYIIEPTSVETENDPLTLNGEDFMTLMLTQIQNQNPLEPSDNMDYITQTAQFSALEQMESMNNSINTMYAFGLMGKEVTIDNGDGTTVTGIVDTVTMSGGSNYLEIDGVQYNSTLVVSAGEPSTSTTEGDKTL
ncbi:MAG: flagellar hook capping protein [Clostridia bacterium]|nr:flagellar hook capping protein [Clostridia bacterium]